MNAKSPKAIWKGTISFSLVTVPVKLYAAIEGEEFESHMFWEKNQPARKCRRTKSSRATKPIQA